MDNSHLTAIVVFKHVSTEIRNKCFDHHKKCSGWRGFGCGLEGHRRHVYRLREGQENHRNQPGEIDFQNSCA